MAILEMLPRTVQVPLGIVRSEQLRESFQPLSTSPMRHRPGPTRPHERAETKSSSYFNQQADEAVAAINKEEEEEALHEAEEEQAIHGELNNDGAEAGALNDAEFDDRYGEHGARCDLRPRKRVTTRFFIHRLTTHTPSDARSGPANTRTSAPASTANEGRDGNPTNPTRAGVTTAPSVEGVLPTENVYAGGQSSDHGPNLNSSGNVFEESETEDAVLGFILSQVSMKRGLKLFGDGGIATAPRSKVMGPVAADSLSAEDKRQALAYQAARQDQRSRMC